jgi:hypothetical protein
MDSDISHCSDDNEPDELCIHVGLWYVTGTRTGSLLTRLPVLNYLTQLILCYRAGDAALNHGVRGGVAVRVRVALSTYYYTLYSTSRLDSSTSSYVD